ncbi:MAG: dihydrolipoyl dehydrogenase [Candidatus Omnitrophica bacterium]|nr:dihydrolipoyl dehydrogenase [Candidatus Omnitrophota bacterium]
MERFDVGIIGAGPGGYTAALYAARLDKKGAVFEKDCLGGTCLNKGCIPTKVLLESANLFTRIKTALSFGVETGPAKLDFTQVNARKDAIIKKLRQGIEAAFKSRGIALFKTHAKLSDINADSIIIATGSIPVELPELRFDHQRILSSDDMLELKEVPKNLLIVGAGAIGCEFATIYNSFGCDVTVAEIADEILPGADADVAKKLRQCLTKNGIKIKTSAGVQQPGDSFEKTLVCAGRSPDTEGLGLEKTGVKTAGRRILVDEYMRTNIANIYAIGDAANKYRLAHTASYEAMIAVDNICGKKRKADYAAVPYCVYTEPEVASVGMTEQAAKEAGFDFKSVRFPFSALGKAHVMGYTDGFVKIIGDRKTGRLLGVHIIGPEATAIIAEAALAVQKGLTAEELSRTIHAHPSLPEGIMEAANIFTEVYLWQK